MAKNTGMPKTDEQQNEQFPLLSSLEAGSADWWREQMRFHLSIVYDSIGKPDPEEAANRLIRLLQRQIKE